MTAKNHSAILPKKGSPFKIVFEQSATGMALLTAKGEWLDVNKRFCRFTGRTRSEVLQSALNDLLPDLTKASLRRLVKDRRTSQLKTSLIHKQGHAIVISLSVSFVKGSDELPELLLLEAQPVEQKRSRPPLLSSGTNGELTSLFEQSTGCVFALDRRGNITYANKTFEKLTGYAKETLSGKNINSLFQPAEGVCEEGSHAKAFKGIPYKLNTWVYTGTKEKQYLNLTSIPIIEQGKTTGFFCIAKAATENKKALDDKELTHRINEFFHEDGSLEDALYDTLRELCTCTGSAAGEAWLTTPDGIAVELCSSFVKGQKQTRCKEKVRMAIGEGIPGRVLQQRKPVSIKNFQDKKSFLKQALATKNKFQACIAIPFVLKDKLTAVFVFYLQTSKIASDQFQFAKSLHVQLAKDIERKKAGEELSSFFTLASDLLCVIGTDGYLRKINGAFSKILGYEEESMLSRPFLEFVHPEDRLLTGKAIRLTAAMPQAENVENRCLSADGHIVWVEWMFISEASQKRIYGVGRNITEAKKLERLIQTEKDRFLEMFNEAPVMMCILLGPDLVFENANALYYKFSGRRNIIGKSVREVFPEAEGQGIFELMERVYQTGEVYTINERLVQLIVNDEGRLEDFYLSFMYQPYRNADGLVEGIFYFGVDVTEQVVARKKIEASRKQYVDLIQNLPVAVYTCDAQGYLQSFNKAAVDLWGREPEIGKDRWCGSWKIYNKEGEQIPHELIPMAISLKERIPLQSEEIQIQKPNGEINHVVAFPSPVFDNEGNLTGGINVLVNISDRKEVEKELQRLSLIATNTINAVIITDPAEKIEWVNEAFTRITGFEFNEAIGRSAASLLHGKDTNPEVVRLMRQKIRRQESFECELLKYTKSGEPFWMEIQGQPLFNAKGELTHYFDLETDITERKKAYERLIKTESEIRNFAGVLNDLLEEERSRIAREIHDEFGQQLTGLKMSLASLNFMPSLDKKAESVVAEMMAGIENTIQSLRNFSTELRPGILDTLGLIPSLEWLAKEFEKKNGIQCSVTSKVRNPAFSKNLSTAFFRVCQEALTNIWKHANATKVSIEIVKSRNKLSLKIKDNGKGIQTKQLEDPLSMGLIGMRERAHLINGRLEITSELNKGTCVHLIAETNV